MISFGLAVTFDGPIFDGRAGSIMEEVCDAKVSEAAYRGEVIVKENAPVRKGDLAASVHIEHDGDLALLVADSDHAAPVEFGHIQGHKNQIHVLPHTFFYADNVESGMSSILEEIPDDVVTALG